MNNTKDIPSIYDVCTPHDDVIEGGLQEDQFAAELSEVVFEAEAAPDIYSNPDEFFDKTYPTGDLQALLTTLAERYVGAATGEFSQTPGFYYLETVFGGGKTHSQIAAYHFSQSPTAIDNLDAFIEDEELAANIQEVSEDLNIHTGVFEGGYVSGTSAKCNNDEDAPDTQTMWGELAYQLAGDEGYELFRENDEARSAPGTTEINNLLELLDGPAVILIDEIAQYYEQAASIQVEGSTLNKQNNSFLWSLARATQNSDDLTVLLSVARTAFEERAEEIEREVLTRVDELDNISERTEQEITPVEDDEMPAIIRKRLFDQIDDSQVSDVLDAYMTFYRREQDALPDHVSTAEYRDEIEQSYPLHPSLLDLLADEIDSLPNFQRTRGALRLVARAIHHAWTNKEDMNANRHFLRIYDMHPSDEGVFNTLIDLFKETDVDLRTAIKNDIYKQGGRASCEHEDERWRMGGKPPVGSHLGVTILWKSIVSGGDNMRGIRRQKLFELVGNPEINFDHYRDALQHLQEPGANPETEAFFLHETETGVLRFRGEARLSRVRFNEEKELENEPGVVRTRLHRAVEGALGGGTFETLYGKEAPHEVPDDLDRVRLCVMSFETVTASSDHPLEDVKEDGTVPMLAEKTGNAPGSEGKRTYKNNVIFLIADEEYVEKAKDTARRQKAYERLINDETGHDLTDAQRDKLRDERNENTGQLGQAVRNTYRHIIYPSDEGLNVTTLSATQSNDGEKLHDIVYEALDDLDVLLPRGEDGYGETWFTQHIWRADPDSMTTAEAREAFGKRRDLPILLHPKPLRETIAKVVQEGPYVLWDKTKVEGFCSADDPAPSRVRDELFLGDAEELNIGINVGDVGIDESQEIYRDGEALDTEHKLSFPSPEPTTGSDDESDDDQDADEDGDSDDDAFEERPFRITNGPTTVSSAFTDTANDLDSEIQAVRDEYDLPSHEIAVHINSIDFTIEGESVWKQTWFLAREINKLDTIGDTAEISNFDYTAKQSGDEDTSQVTVTYDGSVEHFVNHFGVNREPDEFAGTSGEIDGIAELVVAVEDLSDSTRDAVFEPVKDSLSDLSGVNDLTLTVTGKVVQQSEEETTEVSA